MSFHFKAGDIVEMKSASIIEKIQWMFIVLEDNKYSLSMNESLPHKTRVYCFTSPGTNSHNGSILNVATHNLSIVQ